MKRIKRNFALCLIIIMGVLSVRAQHNPDTLAVPSNNPIDSIITSLSKLPNDTASIMIILRRADKYFGIDYTSVLAIINVAETKALITKSPKHIAEVFYKKGMTYRMLANFSEASRYLTMSDIIAERIKNQRLHIVCLAEQGHIYELNGDLEQAMEYYQRALTASAFIKQTRYRAMVFSKIGSIQYRRGEYEESLLSSRESARFFKMDSDTFNTISSLHNLAVMFCLSGQLDSAEYYLNESKQIMDHSFYKNTGTLNSYYNARGTIDMAKKDYKNALWAFQQCLSYSKEMSLPQGILNSYKHISEANEKLGNYKESLKYYQQFYFIMDSLITHENFVKAVDIEKKYKAEKKEYELLKSYSENKIKQAQIQRMNERKTELTNYIILLGSMLVIFTFLLVLLILHISSRRKAYQLLREKNTRIESQSKELSQSAKMIAKFQFQMNPHFVFNALHNIQGLIIAEENSKATEQIQRLATLMRKTFNNAEKDYITLEEETLYLKTYFKFEANTVLQNVQFSVIVTKGLEDALIPPMMIQPFIENALKHAQLKTVENPFITVKITSENDLLLITIADNGKGIQTKKEDQAGGEKSSHSMEIVKSRLELLFRGIFFPSDKDVFKVKTIPEIETGTMVTFYLPLQYLY